MPFDLDLEVLKAKSHIKDYVEMLYIQVLSKENLKDNIKHINEKLIDDYLAKRGYVLNYLLGKRVYVKGFVCVLYNDTYIEVWHDIPNTKSVFIKRSLLTGLPLTLSYMEKV